MTFSKFMLSRMLAWRWSRVLIVFSISIGGSNASNSNTTTSTPTSTSTIAASITSCGSVNLATYLVPSLQALPSASLEAYFASLHIKLNSDYANLERYADSPAADTAAYESLLLAGLSTISADIESVYGSIGHGVLSFQYIATTDPCLFSTCLASYLAESSLIAPLISPALFDYGFYTAAPPCCGQCTITASGVELEYWPTPAPTPPVSVLVNKYNVSYVSPSVYVFFVSLNARNLCGPVGKTYPLEVGTFLPDALSTSSLPTFAGLVPGLGVWSSINYADFDSPKCKCTTNCKYDSILHQYLTNICTPQFSIPPIVKSLDPSWISCANNLFGVFDPPIALTVQAGLTTPKSTPAQATTTGGGNPPPQTTPVPVNGPTPTSPAPPQTPQPQTTNAQPTPNPSPQNGASSVNALPAGAGSSPAPAGGSSPAAPAGGGATQALADTNPTPQPGGGSSSAAITLPLSLIVNGQTITANSQGNFVVGTQTLATNSQGNIVIGTQTLTASGAALTISGTTISLAPGATRSGSITASGSGSGSALGGGGGGGGGGATTSRVGGGVYGWCGFGDVDGLNVNVFAPELRDGCNE